MLTVKQCQDKLAEIEDKVKNINDETTPRIQYKEYLKRLYKAYFNEYLEADMRESLREVKGRD